MLQVICGFAEQKGNPLLELDSALIYTLGTEMISNRMGLHEGNKLSWGSGLFSKENVFFLFYVFHEEYYCVNNDNNI